MNTSQYIFPKQQNTFKLISQAWHSEPTLLFPPLRGLISPLPFNHPNASFSSAGFLEISGLISPLPFNHPNAPFSSTDFLETSSLSAAVSLSLYHTGFHSLTHSFSLAKRRVA